LACFTERQDDLSDPAEETIGCYCGD